MYRERVCVCVRERGERERATGVKRLGKSGRCVCEC
jgi:hypothetical protein